MYSARINGEPTEFGTSGMLYRSNKVMYDRLTKSLWNQFTGEPVIGPLWDSGIVLDFFPVLLTTWEEWTELHPDTTVLAQDTGVYPAGFYHPEGDARAIYYDYFNSPDTMFPVPDQSDLLPNKAIVLGVGLNDGYKAYASAALQRDRLVNDSVGGEEIVVLGSGRSEAGRAYHRDGRTFRLPAGDGAEPGGIPHSLMDAEGGEWLVTEEFLVNAADESVRLARIPTHMSFWFGWYQFHPDTELYTGS